MSVSFGVVTISHGRSRVLEVFCASIKRLRNDLEIFIPCVVVGDEEHRSICEKYHIHFIYQTNHPASRKWNTGVDYLMGIGVDYCMIVGSDDVISTELMRNLITAMEKGADLIGVKNVWFYGADGKHKGVLRKLESTQILGVCRTVHRRVIEKVGQLWTRDRSWGMDSDNARNIQPHCKSKIIVDGMVVDIKTVESLNKITLWLSKLNMAHSPQEFYNILGEEEKQLLEQI